MNILRLIQLVLLLCIFENKLSSQIPYLDPVFSSVDTIDLVYGSNKTYNNQYQNLRMRLFQPIGDTSSLRKCFLWMHGGGFQRGSYLDDENIYICEYMALRGYVSASIEYRLGLGSSSNCISGLLAEYRAAQDYKAAVRYIKKNAEKWNIDTSQLFVGGSSAGAITATHCAYWDMNEVPSALSFYLGDFNSSGNAGHSDAVAGVISWAGGITDSSWLNNETVPFLSIHDEFDNLVAYKYEKVCDYKFGNFYGDYLVSKKLNEQNIYTNLFTYNQRIHVPNIDDEAFYEWVDTTCHQLYRLLNTELKKSTINQILNISNQNDITLTYIDGELHISINQTKLLSKSISLSFVDLLGKEVDKYQIKNSTTIITPESFHGLGLCVFYCPELNYKLSKKILIP